HLVADHLVIGVGCRRVAREAGVVVARQRLLVQREVAERAAEGERRVDSAADRGVGFPGGKIRRALSPIQIIDGPQVAGRLFHDCSPPGASPVRFPGTGRATGGGPGAIAGPVLPYRFLRRAAVKPLTPGACSPGSSTFRSRGTRSELK